MLVDCKGTKGNAAIEDALGGKWCEHFEYRSMVRLEKWKEDQLLPKP